MTPAEQALYESLSDEDIEKARAECEYGSDGFATWNGMTSQGPVKLVWKAVGFWEPGLGARFEMEHDPEFVEEV